MIKEKEVRPYQEAAIDFLIERNGKGAIRATTGAGKTYIALRVVKHFGYERLLILVPRFSAIVPWVNALVKYGFVSSKDEIAIVEKWPKNKRLKLWLKPRKNETDTRPKIVVVLHKTACNDMAYIADEGAGFDFVIVDESHKLRNHQTIGYKKIRNIVRNRRRVFLTATAQSKGVQNLWTTLNMLSPKVFPSYWGFVYRYLAVHTGDYGKEVGNPLKSRLNELKARVNGFVFNIPSTEVQKYIPARNRIPLHVKLDDRMRTIYDTLDVKMMVNAGGVPLITSSVLAKDTRLSQLLACPAIINPRLGVGVGFHSVLEHALDNDPHIVIFSEHVKAFDYWEEHLRSKKIPVYRLQGGMNYTDINMQVGLFERHSKSAKLSVMLCSIAFSESFDLLSPTNAYMLGPSFDQILNYQAEGRLTRGDKRFCNFYYVFHEDTIDQRRIDVINRKVRATSFVSND